MKEKGREEKQRLSLVVLLSIKGVAPPGVRPSAPPAPPSAAHLLPALSSETLRLEIHLTSAP